MIRFVSEAMDVLPMMEAEDQGFVLVFTDLDILENRRPAFNFHGIGFQLPVSFLDVSDDEQFLLHAHRYHKEEPKQSCVRQGPYHPRDRWRA